MDVKTLQSEILELKKLGSEYADILELLADGAGGSDVA